MTVIELAKSLGVSGRQARRKATRLGIAIADRRGYASLSGPDIQALRASLASQRPVDECRLPDNPGLPLEALSDPALREAFTRLRFERERRLIALIRSSSHAYN
ncbi:hypothetical protein FMUAM8_44230 [Nocardia cyriacigeorgica]|nr:hypothetical protein FMUAM8_44230 [Nocardia cyriacigeorgica]